MGFNLSEWALRNRQIVLFLMILLAVVGTLSYTKLGQSEDPPFTFKAMVIKTNWPGATAQEVSRQVTERIEKKLMETGEYERIVSFSRPGESHDKKTWRPGYESGWDRFLVMAGEQLTPTSSLWVQLSPSAISLVLAVLVYGPVVSFQTLEPSTRNGLGWLRMLSAGKFCHTNLVWLAGQLEM